MMQMGSPTPRDSRAKLADRTPCIPEADRNYRFIEPIDLPCDHAPPLDK